MNKWQGSSYANAQSNEELVRELAKKNSIIRELSGGNGTHEEEIKLINAAWEKYVHNLVKEKAELFEQEKTRHAAELAARDLHINTLIAASEQREKTKYVEKVTVVTTTTTTERTPFKFNTPEWFSRGEPSPLKLVKKA